MKKIERRHVILILLTLAALSMVALAAALRQLQFGPGSRLPLDLLFPPITMGSTTSGNTGWMMVLVRIFFIILWACVPIYLIYLILSPEARKQFLRDLVSLIPIAVVLYFLMSTMMNKDNPIKTLTEGMMGQEPLQEAEQVAPITPPVFNNNPPDWIVTLTTITIAVTITGLLVFAGFLFIRAREARLAEAQPLKKIALDAQAAIDAIEAGGDLRDVSQKAYFQMANTVAQARALHRGHDMTPHEFELYLRDRGLPAEPVHQLTVLFEQVRYGGYTPGRQDERNAITSLNAIVSVLRRST